MAAGGGDVAQAGGLLAAYSLGLGVPFMLTALALDSAQNVLRRLQRHMHKIELASGAFLILIGVLVATGQLQALSQRFAGEFADFSITVEEGVLEALVGSEEGDTTESGIIDDLDNNSATTSSETQESGSVEGAQSHPDVSPTLVVPAGTGENTAVGSITELASNSSPSVGIAVGNFAPDFETISDDGQPIKLSDYRGEIVLLNFWATWCGPCRLEMPEFEAAFKEHGDKGFNIIAVNNAETAADVQGFRDEFGLSFTLALDERADIQNQYNIFSYPSTFILGRDGTILARHYGAITAEVLQEMVDDALAA
jgi:peroxiredoxin